MPGRNVGSIEVTVDANTGKLKAQITKAGKSAGEAGGKAIEEGLSDVDGRELVAKLDKIKAQAERALSGVEIDIGVDDAQARADLKKLEAQLREAQLDLHINTEMDEQAQHQIAALRVRLQDAVDFEIHPTLNRTEVAAVTSEAESLLQDIDVEVRLQLEKATAESELREFTTQSARQSIGLSAEMDLTRARAAVQFFREQQERNDIEIPVDIDIDSIEAQLKRMEGFSRLSGQNAGKGFGGGFADVLPGEIAEWIPLVAAFIGPLGQVLQGATGGAIQVVSSAFSALGGAAGAAAPLVAGLGATLGAVVVGSLGVGKAISAVTKEFASAAEEGRAFDFQAEEIQKTLGNLGPAAEGVVRAFADVFPQLRAIQNIVAEHLFAGLGDELHALANETIPDIGTSLALAGDSANRFFRGISTALQEVDFTGTFLAVQPAVDSLGRAITTVVRAIEPFLKAAAPAARELADSIEAAARSFLGMVQRGADSGAITRFLMDGVESLKDWGRLLKTTGDALFTLFQAGKSGGDGMVQSLTKIVQKWDDWMESARGQQALQDFFALSRQLLSDLVPLIKGLADGISHIVTPAAAGSFRDLATNLGDVLRVAGELIGVFNRMNITGTVVAAFAIFARALEPMIPDLEDLADAIGTSLASGLRAVTPLIQLAARLVGDLATVLTPLAPLITAIGLAWGTWKVMSSLGGFIGGITSGLSTMSQGLQIARGAIADTGTALTLTGTALREIGAGIKGFNLSAVKQGFSDLGVTLPALAKGAGSIAGVALASGIGIAFGAQMAIESDNIAGKVQGIATILTSAFTAFAVGGPIAGGIALAIGGVMTLFQQSAEAAKRAKAEIGEYVDAIGGLGPAFNKVNFVKTILQNLTDETEETRQGFLKMGVSIGDWAADLADGGKSTSAMVDMMNKLGPAGKTVAQALQDSGASADDFSNALEVVADGGTGTSASLGLTSDQINAMIKEFNAAGISTEQLVNMFDFLGDESAESGSAMSELALRNKEAGSAADLLSASSAEAATGISETGDAASTSAAAQVAYTKAMTALSEAMSNVDGTAKAAAQGFGSIEDAVFGVAAPMSAAEAAMIGVGNAARTAASDADAMRGALDLLVSPALDGQAALSDYKQAVDDLGKSLTDNGKSLDLNSQKGRDNAEQVRTNVEAIASWGEAALKGGAKAEDVTRIMGDMRNELISQVGAFDTGALSAEQYVDQLGLTPDSIKTIVETPGLLEASQTILGYDRDLDGITDNVDTIFNAENLDAIKAKLAEYGVDLTGVPDSVLTEYLTKGFEVAKQQTDTAQAGMDKLDGTVASPDIVIPTAPATQEQIIALQTGVDGLAASSAAPAVTVPTAPAAQEQVAGVQTSMDTLNAATAQPTVAMIGNYIVLIQLAAIDQAINELAAKSAQPKVSLPTFPLVAAQTIAMMTLLAQLNSLQANPQVRLPTFPLVIAQTLAMMALLSVLNSAQANPRVTLPTYGTVVGQFGAMIVLAAVLDGMNVSVSVSTPGLDEAISGFGRLGNAISAVDGRTATVTTTTRNVTENQTVTLPPVGGMAGALIGGPMMMQVGELGYREALVPLDLPLNRVNPSVRGYAEMLRGDSAAQGVIQRQVNVYNSIEVQSPNANPIAVATQVVNRAAAMAN